MNIYTLQPDEDRIPEGFQAVSLALDAGLKSSLEWNAIIEKAKLFKDQGYKIFWNLDMGLFHDLPQSLDHGSQFESLKLSIEHFNQTIWSSFGDVSVGVSLYRGSDQLSEEQVEFLDFLVGYLHDEAEPFIFVDVSVEDPVLAAQSVSKERYPHFTLAVRGEGLPMQEYGWDSQSGFKGFIGRELKQSNHQQCTVALCIPSTGSSIELVDAIEKLTSRHIVFRMVPESLLTTEWHGLDYILVDPNTLSFQGRRKLMGFCAAGGAIVSLGDFMDLPFEISLKDYLEVVWV